MADFQFGRLSKKSFLMVTFFMNQDRVEVHKNAFHIRTSSIAAILIEHFSKSRIYMAEKN